MFRHRKHKHGDTPDEAHEDARLEEHQKGSVIHPEPLHPEHLAASLEDVEKLFAPDDEPREHDYGAQPPG